MASGAKSASDSRKKSFAAYKAQNRNAKNKRLNEERAKKLEAKHAARKAAGVVARGTARAIRRINSGKTADHHVQTVMDRMGISSRKLNRALEPVAA